MQKYVAINSKNASGKTILEMRRILAIIFVSEAYPAFTPSVPS